MLLKKLALCSKVYDYKDETKDVKAKVTIEFMTNIPYRLTDWHVSKNSKLSSKTRRM